MTDRATNIRRYFVMGFFALALTANGFSDAVPESMTRWLVDLAMVATGLAGLFSKPPEIS
jgi:hypothetical protein